MSWRLLEGDCTELMRSLPENSVDAICADPPYGLSREPDIAEVLTHWLAGDDYVHRGGGFMGQSWDSFVPGPSVWRECLRVLKPGGHLLAFAGTRTADLMGLAIRLAGFERRDTIANFTGAGDLTWVYGDRGGASRFFYCAKASRAERNAGLQGFEAREGGSLKAGGRHVDSRVGRVRSDGAVQGAAVPNRQNVHPTVKPIALMRWLVRLVAPPGGLVLDPFGGSGTTLLACILEGFDCIVIEREAEYIPIIEARAEHVEKYREDYLAPAPKPVAPMAGQLGFDDEAAA